MLDLPGIISGAADNKGRGRQVIGVARTCGLIMIVLDSKKPLGDKKIIEGELEGFGIRLNKKPPKIRIRKLTKGPVNIIKIVKQTHMDDKTIEQICREYKYNSCELMLRQDTTMDELIDALEGNRTYIPCIYLLNMIDKISIEELDMLSRIPKVCCISGRQNWNIEKGLLPMIWKELKMIRIYTKPKGSIPDITEPVIMKKDKGCTVEDFCNKIHKTLADNFKYAWVWGTSVKHTPQKVGKEHKLQDEDVVQVVTK